MKKTIIISSIIFVALGVLIYLIRRTEARKVKQIQELSDENETIPSYFSFESEFPLGIGSQGNEVINLQKALNRNRPLVMLSIDEDGFYGADTEALAQTILGNLTGHRKNMVTWTEYNSLA